MVARTLHVHMQGHSSQWKGKKASIGLYEMNQVVGHAVTYGFIHAKRHPSHNLFIPAIGLQVLDAH